MFYYCNHLLYSIYQRNITIRWNCLFKLQEVAFFFSFLSFFFLYKSTAVLQKNIKKVKNGQNCDLYAGAISCCSSITADIGQKKGQKTKQVTLFVCFCFFHLRSILLNIFISLRKKTTKKDKTLFFFFLTYSLKYRLLIYISVSHFSSVRGIWRLCSLFSNWFVQFLYIYCDILSFYFGKKNSFP